MGIRKVKKEELLEQATNLFRTRGYHGTGMQHIADALDINKASLYHHVIDKENLGRVVLQRVRQHFHDHIFILAYETSSAKDRLTRLGAALEAYFIVSKGGCLMANFTLELGQSIPVFASEIQGFFEDWINALAHIFSVRCTIEQAKELATESVARFQGTLIQYRLGEAEGLLRERQRLIEQFEEAKSSQ